MFLQLLAALFIAVASSLLTFRNLIRKYGLDPALISYSNIFTRYNFWIVRVSMVVAVFVALIWPTGGQILLAVIGFCFAWLIIILLMFSRTPTQPTAYYVFITLSTLCLSAHQTEPRLLFSACFYLIGELNLYFWRRHQKYFYDKWVSNRARRILKKYHSTFTKMPPNYRFDVLHVAATEDIARPAIVRLAERAYFHIKKPAYISTGIMQVRGTRPISDQESMKRGSAILIALLIKMPQQASDIEKMKWIARHYNDSDSYADLLAATLPGVKDARA